MTVKNSQLTEAAIKAINGLIEKDINAASAFRLSRMVKELSSLVDLKIESEKKIFNKYVARDPETGEYLYSKDEEGNDIKTSVQITDIEAFNKEMKDLMDVETDISTEKINFESLGLDKIAAKELMHIDFIFE